MRRARSPAERNGPTATASRRITAHGNDFFCTGDEARPGHPSILDAATIGSKGTSFTFFAMTGFASQRPTVRIG